MTVVTEVLAVEISADEVSAEDVSEVEDVPPVLNATLWRFAIPTAMSRPLAEAEGTMRKASRNATASERMMMVNSSASQGQ